MRIALAGNPNSGKTTLFNAITGKNERVGNWAGVTVDKRESPVKKNIINHDEEIIIVDLPGAYSLSPFTSEENVTSEYIKKDNPDVIINIVDATNLSRSLFFTTQLLELGIPVVVALNKSDINEKKDTVIDVSVLSNLLGCPVIETVSINSAGLSELLKLSVNIKGTVQKAPFSNTVVSFTDKSSARASDRARYLFVNKIVSSVEKKKINSREITAQDKLDIFLTNKWLGIPVFVLVMWGVFYISQAWLGPVVSDFLVGGIEFIGKIVENLMKNANPFLSSLVTSAIIDGVGGVISFLPLVMIMYFLIALLEDCGYMARATVVLDPIFKKVGLSGKSVIPFIVGTGCAVPGIMSCRTIKNEHERRATALIAPFMPCGAKLPVISLFVGAFFPGNGWIGTAMYFLGIIIILLCALLINTITGYKHKKSYFIIELPEYKLPSLIRATKSMIDRGWAYIIKAGTIILICNVAITLMCSFTPSLKISSADGTDSILAYICGPLEWILVPIIGIASWRLVACAITGFIAKENVVGTVASLYGLSSIINSDLELIGESSAVTDALGIVPIAALAYMMFNLFTPPCFAAIGAMNAELKSTKWLLGGIGLQLSVGFTVGFITYQTGTLLTTDGLGAGFVPGLIFILSVTAILTFISIKNNKKVKAKELP